MPNSTTRAGASRRLCRAGKTNGDPAAHVKEHNKRGTEKVILLDPPEIAFELKRLFGDFVLPCVPRWTWTLVRRRISPRFCGPANAG